MTTPVTHIILSNLILIHAPALGDLVRIETILEGVYSYVGMHPVARIFLAHKAAELIKKREEARLLLGTQKCTHSDCRNAIRVGSNKCNLHTVDKAGRRG